MRLQTTTRRILSASVLAASLAFLPVPALADPTFTLTDLGTLGRDASRALHINSTGHAAGYSLTPGSVDYYALLYSGGAITPLGTLGGSTSLASGIKGRLYFFGNFVL